MPRWARFPIACAPYLVNIRSISACAALSHHKNRLPRLVAASGRLIMADAQMTKAFPALASVALLAARGLLSLVLGACAFPQSTRPQDTPDPSLFQLQHTSWTEREGAPPRSVHAVCCNKKRDGSG